jgi:dolichyl-phosphate beta-glucosyltransferase
LATHLAVVGAFTLPSVYLWWHAWTGGAASTVRCDCLDPGQQIWFIAWPAYALVHGLDPFSTGWLWPPHGVNLLANASAPLLGVLLAPLTWLVGPVAATTVALTLAPGASAWGCWVACRRFVDWLPACWVAGFVFGYSPFIVESVAQGHLSTGVLVLLPLLVVVLHEMFVRRTWSPLRCGVSLGVILAAQFLISEEILTIAVVLTVVGVIAAAVLAPRQALVALPFVLKAIGIAALVTAILLLGPVWYALAGPGHITGSVWSGLHQFIVAQAWEIWRAGPVATVLFPGALQGPQVQFVGYGLLVVSAASVALAWRRRSVWVMAVIALAATVLSWGGILWLSPDHFVVGAWLPWSHFTNLAVLDDISAVHFSAVADLGVAVVVAIGLDALHRTRPWARVPFAVRVVGMAGIVALMAVPVWSLYEAPLSVQPVNLPRWYATAALHIPEQSVVTSYPFPASADVTSQPMVWQAVDGMRFKLAGGYVKVPGSGTGVLGTGPAGSATWTLDTLTLASADSARTFPTTPLQIRLLRKAIRSWKTAYIIVVDRGTVPTEAAGLFTAATGRMPQVVDRAWVWNLRQSPIRHPAPAARASRAFGACRAWTADLEEIPQNRPLPQSFNRCVASGMRV